MGNWLMASPCASDALLPQGLASAALLTSLINTRVLAAPPYPGGRRPAVPAGVDSAGIARLLALHPSRFPHDMGTPGRHGQALAGLPGAARPWSPLEVRDALAALVDGPVRVVAVPRSA